MVRKNHSRIILALAIALVMFPSFAQKTKKSKEEDIVRLVKAKSIEQVEIDGEQFRKSVAATFSHNGMILSCDTALWNTQKEIINAFGHVKIRQDKVVLTSDKLDYDIQLEVATFRGSIVEMKDNNNNILRTENLDYYTKDSLAVFRDGASMRGEDGQVIESVRGTYSGKIHKFTFTNKVNMFTDSVLILTNNLEYFSDEHIARFPDPVDFWKGSNMLSALRGWYDRSSETFYFENSVHAMSPDQEVWCDSMYFYRVPNDVMMLGDVQMQDTSRNLMAVSQYMLYEDSLQQVTLRDEAAIAIETQSYGEPDTVYCGGDEIRYYTVKKHLIPEKEFADSKGRLDIFSTDPIGTYRKEAAEAAAKRAQELYEQKMEEEHPGWAEQQRKLKQQEEDAARQKAAEEAAKQKAAPTDTTVSKESVPTTEEAAVADTTLSKETLTVKDTLPARDMLSAEDTVAIGFLSMKGTVQVFKKDLQVLCDSLEYCDLDSIARFYKDPIIWNEANRQYSSDSLFALVRNGSMERAALESNAMILTQEEENLFDQIKAIEVMAYFNKDAELTRFDALGDAKMLFFLEENGVYATANRVESKMLTGTFLDGEIQRVTYYTKTNNDAYPVAQMSEKDRRFEGFNWSPDKRPRSKEDITSVRLNQLERNWYLSKRKPTYPISEKYFPGYMSGVLYGLSHPEENVGVEQEIHPGPKTIRDTIPAGDTLALPRHVSAEVSTDAAELSLQETVAEAGTPAESDTVGVAGTAKYDKDAAATVAGAAIVIDSAESEATQKERALEERKAKAEQREKAKAERERMLNERDAEKAAKKAQKKLEQERKKKARLWTKQQKRISREQDILYKYVERYERERQRQLSK